MKVVLSDVSSQLLNREPKALRRGKDQKLFIEGGGNRTTCGSLGSEWIGVSPDRVYATTGHLCPVLLKSW